MAANIMFASNRSLQILPSQDTVCFNLHSIHSDDDKFITWGNRRSSTGEKGNTP
ncbi:hypothetical protein Hanom_Chr05g00402051 [Helianthus anomalus]